MKDNPKCVYAYGWTRFNMAVIGIWPEANGNIFLRYRAWAYSLLILIFIWIPQLASVTVFWGNMNETIECLSTNVPIGVSIMKLVVFRSRRKVLSDLLKLVEEDWAHQWTKEEEVIMMTITKISRFISSTSSYVTTALLVAYVSAGVFFGVQNWNNPDVDSRLSVSLLYSVILPYDTRNMYNFVSTWIAQFAGTCFALVAYSGPDAFMAMLVLHVCGQLAIVRLSIKNIVNEACLKDPRIFYQKLSAIVQRHEELNRRTQMIEDSFNLMLLVLTLVVTITLCFQAFARLTTLMDLKESDISYLNLTIFVLHSVSLAIHTVMHLFVYCWVGDLLITESSAIGISPYESQWYLMAPTEIKALMLVTYRSRTPLQITAGKFGSFSLELFTIIWALHLALVKPMAFPFVYNSITSFSIVFVKKRGRKCIVPGCKRGYSSNLDRVSFIDVPKDSDLRTKWVRVIQPTSEKLIYYM